MHATATAQNHSGKSTKTRRTFAVKSMPEDLHKLKKHTVMDGYITINPNFEQRIRNVNGKCIMIARSIGPLGDVVTEEPLDPRIFELLWSRSKKPSTERTIYTIPHPKVKLSLHVYHGPDKGIVFAEVGTSTAVNGTLELPDWVGTEITHPSLKIGFKKHVATIRARRST